MFSAVFLSILWEIYTQPPKETSPHNETYSYPVFVLDFEQVYEERQDLAWDYGYTLDDVRVERRSCLSLEEFWDLYDAKW